MLNRCQREAAVEALSEKVVGHLRAMGLEW